MHVRVNIGKFPFVSRVTMHVHEAPRDPFQFLVDTAVRTYYKLISLRFTASQEWGFLSELRPYAPSGFLVSRECLSEKTCFPMRTEIQSNCTMLESHVPMYTLSSPS